MHAKVEYLEGVRLNEIEVVELSQFDHKFKDGKFSKEKKYPLITGTTSDGKNKITKVRILQMRAAKDDLLVTPSGRKRTYPSKLMESDNSFSEDEVNKSKKSRTQVKSTRVKVFEPVQDGNGDVSSGPENSPELEDREIDNLQDPLRTSNLEACEEQPKTADQTAENKERNDDGKIAGTLGSTKNTKLKKPAEPKASPSMTKDKDIGKLKEERDASMDKVKKQKIEICKLQNELQREKKLRKDLNDKYEKVQEDFEVVSQLNRNLQQQIIDRFTEQESK
ncbi:hypothetical protein QAD02_002944 [Eretmocerus hayati]|uniref:Uncharacterized protein n=1 Tax=Eretmocerus hayati TaxID=131215 RepID=A0ACC2NQ79_9HYME|nr:hypothetical protein QAD02_002944 [Eretmocerus hayati]